jgi:hypothetical protein
MDWRWTGNDVPCLEVLLDLGKAVKEHVSAKFLGRTDHDLRGLNACETKVIYYLFLGNVLPI